MILNENLFDDYMLFDAPQPQEEFQLTAEDMAVSSIINQAIQNAFSNVDLYNSVLVSLPEGYEEVRQVLQTICNDENRHIGMLQGMLGKVNPMTLERKAGEASVEEVPSDNVVIVSDGGLF